MKLSEVVVDNEYTVAREPPRYNAWSWVASGHTNKPSDKLAIGDILKCTVMHKGAGYSYTSGRSDPTYSEYEILTGMQAGKKIRVTSHGFLQPASDFKQKDRPARIAALNRIISKQKEQLESLQKEVSSLETNLAINNEKLEKLIEYPTDEAELAHALAEIMRAGGSEEKILETLLKMTDTGDNIVKKMVTKSDKKTAVKKGISTLLEY